MPHTYYHDHSIYIHVLALISRLAKALKRLRLRTLVRAITHRICDKTQSYEIAHVPCLSKKRMARALVTHAAGPRGNLI